MKAILSPSKTLTETEMEYASGGRPYDVRLYELLLKESPERVFRRMIQQQGPPLFSEMVWKSLSFAFILLCLADVYVVVMPNLISIWLINSFGALPAAAAAFTFLFVFPAMSFGSWRLATRRPSSQYEPIPPATNFELLEVPSKDARFTCPECKGVGRWAKTRYQEAHWEAGGTVGEEETEGEKMVFVPDQIEAKETVCKTCSGKGYLRHMRKRFEKANKRLQRLNSNLDVVNSKVEALNLIITEMNMDIVQRRPTVHRFPW